MIFGFEETKTRSSHGDVELVNLRNRSSRSAKLDNKNTPPTALAKNGLPPNFLGANENEITSHQQRHILASTSRLPSHHLPFPFSQSNYFQFPLLKSHTQPSRCRGRVCKKLPDGLPLLEPC